MSLLVLECVCVSVYPSSIHSIHRSLRGQNYDRSYRQMFLIASVCVRRQMMECTGRCVAVSEPDSLNIVATNYRKFGDSPEVRQLSRDIVRCECRPYPTMQPLGYLVKFSSFTSAVLPMFR